MAGVRLTLDQAAVRRLTLDRQGPVGGGLEKIAVRVVGEAKRRCPVDEGRLRASITYNVLTVGAQLSARVGTNVEYARFVHDGRGPVFPVSAKVLRFKPKGSSQFIFRSSVGPAEAQPFLREALVDVVSRL